MAWFVRHHAYLMEELDFAGEDLLRNDFKVTSRLFQGYCKEKRPLLESLVSYGAPVRIRTPDLLIRSQPLYPTELQVHVSLAYHTYAQYARMRSVMWRRGRDSNPR